VQLCDEDGCLEANGACSRAILEVPEDTFPVLACAQEIAVIGRPAQRLDLARVATELARDAVGLNVEDDYNAVVLGRLVGLG